MRRGLTARMIVVSGLLVMLGGLFAAVLVVNRDQRDARRHLRDSRAELAAAEEVFKLLVDLETGQRGFVITGREVFLEPWHAARAAYPGRAQEFVRLVDDPAQKRKAQEIARGGASYIRDHSVPLVEAMRRGDPSARSFKATAEGKRRVDALRARFDRFGTAERALVLARQRETDSAENQAVVAATIGLGASLLLILLITGYLTRAIIQPVRRAAGMATQLAAGDLAVRMPETSVGEIGELERSFNTMGRSLEASHSELRTLAEQQAALRRVATLVAEGVAPTAVFRAVTRELGLLSGADLARMERYEPDGTVTAVAAWSRDGEAPLSVGKRFALDGLSIAALARDTRHPVRVDTFAGATGPIAEEARALGIRSSVGCPIVVGGELWGVVAASTKREEPFPADTESQIAEFTELVATAIANADSRSELIASRARVVGAADASRRRIERDLHDGTQQRLVSLGLELRAAEAMVPPGLDDLHAQLTRASASLSGAVEDLQEVSRGIHPPSLRKGGLGMALRTLARRSPVPVELDIRADRRLPEPVEVAAYYIVSEALTNAAKHAHASVVHVVLDLRQHSVRVAIDDDGDGGADAGRGSGLVGLRDRVEALGGKLEITSPAGSGTSVHAEIPL